MSTPLGLFLMAHFIPDNCIGVGRVYVSDTPGSDKLHLATSFEIEKETCIDSLIEWLDILIEAGYLLDAWVMIRDEYHTHDMGIKLLDYFKSLTPPHADSASL